MIFWAKTGYKIKLEEHVQNLEQEAKAMLEFRAFVLQKYRERTGKQLEDELQAGITWHDEGKKDEKWQYHCCRNSLHLAEVRHELMSLVMMRSVGQEASQPVRAAIAAHHSKLGKRYEKRWKERPEFQDIKLWGKFGLWGQFVNLGDGVASVEEAVRKRYEYDGPRSWLQLVDRRASARESKKPEDIPIPFRSFQYTFPYKGKERGVQKKIEEFWNKPFAILRAPTGAGKTDAALLWAQHQIECNRADRLVIAMPTRFTAKSLAISKPEEISSRGLYHSTSRFVHRGGSQLARKEADKEQDMARLLETPITVTTLDHLCICLTGTREDHHGIFFNLAHSCVVIDEADFYDAFTQQNMVLLLTALRHLNVHVLLMSATVPDSARELYTQSGYDVSLIYEDTSDNDRVRCRLTRQGCMEVPNDIAGLLERALKGKPTIIYANTVRRAQDYYHWFRERDPEFTEKHVVCYHSRFTEPDKCAKEERLTRMLGKNAWTTGEKKRYGVAILTQIGELSVNISADLMISDLCPIDRLAQRVGRLARFHNEGDELYDKGGELYLVEPRRTSRNGVAELYPAPYGHWDNGWKMSKALAKSDELLKDGEYTAQKFIDLVDTLYPVAETELPERVLRNIRNFKHLLRTNWLWLPAEAKSNKREEEYEEDRTDDWFSRDVPPQRTLYVGYKPTGMVDNEEDGKPRTWAEFREFQLRHGVQCHNYEFNTAFRSGLLQKSRDQATFTLEKDHEETIWTVPEIYYDFETGLHLTEESD